MDSAASTFASTKETTNYARLCRLLVGVGTEVLRKVFDKVRPQGALSEVLASPSVMSALQSLKGRVLNPSQWDKLFPSNKHKVSSTEFDITLLMVLVRNICDLAPPSTGWDGLPPATDKSKQADIARIKYYRNTVYGHANKASLHDTEYSKYWQEIKDTLVQLGGQQYENTINDLETVCMDPEMEGRFQDLLRQWVKDDENIKDGMDEIKDKLDKITETLERQHEDLKKAVTSGLEDQSRAPSALVSTSMNAHMDSLGSVSTPSVFSGVSIGTVTNSPIQVKNEFHGNVNFVNNICRQNDKQDTDKD